MVNLENFDLMLAR